jgi:hypothetical protein
MFMENAMSSLLPDGKRSEPDYISISITLGIYMILSISLGLMIHSLQKRELLPTIRKESLDESATQRE